MQLFSLVSHNSFKNGSVYVCIIDFLCILYCIYGSETLIKYLYLYLYLCAVKGNAKNASPVASSF